MKSELFGTDLYSQKYLDKIAYHMLLDLWRRKKWIDPYSFSPADMAGGLKARRRRTREVCAPAPGAIEALQDAKWAGELHSEECTLIITEGESAGTFAVSNMYMVSLLQSLIMLLNLVLVSRGLELIMYLDGSTMVCMPCEESHKIQKKMKNLGTLYIVD